jgi:vesicular inhibitory amino acid transporter
LIVFIDGFVKPDAPGSLRDPAQTYLFPANWLTLPLSFGLLMSPLGGHSVFPSIYRDMRHPHKYGKAVKMSFSFTYVLNTATAAAGHLMFGDDVMDEISSNILAAAGYPRALTILMSIFIAIIPLTKLPLNARPIVSTVELFSGLNAQYLASSSDLVGLSAWSRGLLKIVVRVVVIIIFVMTAIIFPAFDAIMALMGSLLCSTVCVILPCMFYLKLYGKEIPRWERWLNYVLITVFSIFAVIGTVFACLPKTMIGAE